MKRTLCIVMLLAALITNPAFAMEALHIGDPYSIEDRMDVHIESAGVYDAWNGETSETHSWIAVGLSVTNYQTESIDLNDALGAQLVYDGKYEWNFQWMHSNHWCGCPAIWCFACQSWWRKQSRERWTY